MYQFHSRKSYDELLERAYVINQLSTESFITEVTQVGDGVYRVIMSFALWYGCDIIELVEEK